MLAAPGGGPGAAGGAGEVPVTLTDTEPLPGVGTVIFTDTVPGGGGGELSSGTTCACHHINSRDEWSRSILRKAQQYALACSQSDPTGEQA